MQVRDGRVPARYVAQAPNADYEWDEGTFTSGPAAMLHNVAPGRSGGFT